MTRIIIIGKQPPPYMGTAVWFDALVTSGLKEKFEVMFFNVNVHTDFSSLGTTGIHKIWPNIKLYRKFRKDTRKFKPDLVLVPISQQTIGFVKDSIFILLVPKSVKILVMLHGSNLLNWLGNSGKTVNSYMSFIMKKTTGAIVLGNKLRYLFDQWFDEDAVHVVPNGLDIDFTGIGTQKEEKTVIRYLANLSEAKGIMEVVNALDYVQLPPGSYELRVNGHWRSAELQNRFREIIKEKQLPVIYEGLVTGQDKLIALRNSDLFVFTPNEAEGHPLVVVEAMAAGLPVISTDQGAITESVWDGENGFIVPPADPRAIANKIELLVHDIELRKRMGRRSRELYEQHFTEEKMVDKLAQAINKTLQTS